MFTMMAQLVLLTMFLFQILYYVILAMLFLPFLMQITKGFLYKHLGDRQLSKTDNYSKGQIVWCYIALADLENSSDCNSLLSYDINEAWNNWSQKFFIDNE